MPFRDSELNAFAEQIKAIKGSTSALTIVCGTGVSMASVNENLKEKISWPALIQQGLEFAQVLGLNVTEELNQIQTPEQKRALNADQLIELAGKVQKHLQEQDQYENWLQNNVGDAVLPDPNKMILIKALAECAKISHVNLATTNYDYLLSRAQGWTPAMPEHPNSPISWQDRSGLTSWMQDRSERVLHLHGDAYNAESVIFSQADYDRLNKDGEDGWTSRIRSAISTTHVVLFIGCGNTTNDPAFKRILKLYEATLAANRFNTKWFQLAKNDEHRFPRGIKKLTYGNEYDDLPIFVKDTLLALLNTHLAKTEKGKNETTEIVENNQTPLQVLTQIRQTENLTDIGNNQNSPTATVMQQPSIPISSDVQNEETNLVKKLINSIFSKLETADQNQLMQILTPNIENEHAKDKFERWLKETNSIQRISDIQSNWNTFKQVSEKFWSNLQVFVMLLAINAYVERYNNQDFELLDKYVKDFENCILPIMVVVNTRYGVGCSLELVDGKWRSTNVIRHSTMQPAEAYRDFNIGPIMNELSPLMLDAKSSGSDDELMQINIKNFEHFHLAKPCLILDGAQQISEIQKDKFNKWGLTSIYPKQELDEQLQSKFESMLIHLNSLSPVLKQSAVDNLKQNQLQLLSLIQNAEEKRQLLELIETLKQDPNLNKPESKSKADQVYTLIERIKTTAETVPAVTAALPILQELAKQILNLIK